MTDKIQQQQQMYIQQKKIQRKSHLYIHFFSGVPPTRITNKQTKTDSIFSLVNLNL